MANQYFRARLRNNISGALAAAVDAGQIGHAGMQGRIREIVLNDLVKPLLPADVAVGTGKIVDAFGRESSQIDIVIYSPRLLPPLLYAPNEGLFPIEACFFAIEVKSRVTGTEVRDATDKFRSLRALQMTSGNTAAPVALAVSTLLFAYNTDLAVDGKTELSRYRELDLEADRDPLMQGMCVVGRGYWLFSRVGQGRWITAPLTSQHEEVIDLLGGIVNSFPEKIALRGLPSLGQYVLVDKEHGPA